MHHSVTLFAIATLSLVACDGDDGGSNVVDASLSVDATHSTTDAPVVTNGLGQLCSVSAPTCPAGNSCVTIMGAGSSTTGYCSPMCNNMNVLCSRGYSGPAGGQTFCALTQPGHTAPNLCAITCTTAAQCPTGLDCLTVSNEKVCVPPP